jgi:hypothetical protein
MEGPAVAKEPSIVLSGFRRPIRLFLHARVHVAKTKTYFFFFFAAFFFVAFLFVTFFVAFLVAFFLVAFFFAAFFLAILVHLLSTGFLVRLYG